MDCNKDEAIRAKEIAEKKMKMNDFVGAVKVALKARSLYPELDGITQMLCVCEVHCSAQKGKLGSERDLYGILQVERLADDVTVKKQYRRLALTLHPDKNRFPGAEGAFKLICEANAVLSDPCKKSMYDNKVRALLRSTYVNPPSNGMNENVKSGSPLQVQKSVTHGINTKNQQYEGQPAFSIRQEVFWTSCPFCDVKYQYHRHFVNRILQCQTCKRTFVGYEIIARDVPVGSKPGKSESQHFSSKGAVRQTADYQKIPFPEQGDSKDDLQHGSNNLSSGAGSDGRIHRETFQPVGRGSSSDHIEDTEARVKGNFKGTGTDTCKISRKEGKSGNTNSNAIRRRSRVDTDKSRKSSHGTSKEDSESWDGSSFSSMENIKGNGDCANDPCESKSSRWHLRRSSRKRWHFSYNEDDEDNRNSHLKIAYSALDKNEKQRSELMDGDSVHASGSGSHPNNIQHRNKGTETLKSVETLQVNNACHDNNASKTDESPTVKIENGDKNSHIIDNADEDLREFPDPEFNDFDVERAEGRFQINQFWACYDTLDGMPRYYAKVKRVCTSPFELDITWLEAVPVDKMYEKWVEEELPVGCGNFRLGITDKTSARMTFSHLIHCEKGKKKGSFVINPREGEVWALFKDWDVSWSSKPENHKEFKYEIVEVLSTFVDSAGIKVVYLEKINGFVSLFRRASECETSEFFVQPNQIYMFSHRVPCFRMRGSEREGVPVGALELDPASIPLNPDNLSYPGKKGSV